MKLLSQAQSAHLDAEAVILNQPDNALVLHLNPGDCIVMQNDRSLHGRTAFDPNRGHRLLQGCYIDSDAMRSRYAVLSQPANL